MKSFSKIALTGVAAFFPMLVFAATDDALTRLIDNIVAKILQPIVWLLFALAMFYFVNGIATFMLKADDPKARAKGRQEMIWGVVGFFIMVSVYAILSIVTNTFGIELPENTGGGF